MNAAMAPRWTKLTKDGDREWQCYVWTRFYLSWATSDRDEHDIALLMAASQERRGDAHDRPV